MYWSFQQNFLTSVTFWRRKAAQNYTFFFKSTKFYQILSFAYGKITGSERHHNCFLKLMGVWRHCGCCRHAWARCLKSLQTVNRLTLNNLSILFGIQILNGSNRVPSSTECLCPYSFSAYELKWKMCKILKKRTNKLLHQKKECCIKHIRN